MKVSNEIERAVVENVKFGALAVLNMALRKTITAGTNPELWSAEDKMKYFLILDVQDEILRRVSHTFSTPKRKHSKERIGRYNRHNQRR